MRIVLELPEGLGKNLRRAAEKLGMSVEELIVKVLHEMMPEEPAGPSYEKRMR